MELVPIDAKRKEKAAKCDFCGAPEHAARLACPRIESIRYEGDVVTVEFWPPDDEPPAAA